MVECTTIINFTLVSVKNSILPSHFWPIALTPTNSFYDLQLRKHLRLCPRYFLGFTRALTFPMGYNRAWQGYILCILAKLSHVTVAGTRDCFTVCIGVTCSTSPLHSKLRTQSTELGRMQSTAVHSVGLDYNSTTGM